MVLTAKKPKRKSTRAVAKQKPSARKPANSRAVDAAERKKIGQSLDVASFMAHHERNTASSAYWENKE
jgi:hypothetical protein